MASRILQWVVYLIIRLLHWTYRFRPVGGVHLPASQHYVLAIWHQNLFAGILAQTGRQHVVIISRSRDGDFVSNLCTRLGHRVARGSSRSGDRDKGGRIAKGEMVELLDSGLSGAITVDGPRGPAFEVKPGIVEMARLAQVPIIPYLPLPRRYWQFKSWDAFRVPKPFTRVDVHFGAPIHVGPDTPFDAYGAIQGAVAARLNDLERTHNTRH